MGSLTIKKAPTTAEVLERAKRQQLSKLNDDYEAAAQPLIKDYPWTERLGWGKQLDEATRYRNWQDGGGTGGAPPTPALDRILKGRNGTGGTETLDGLVDAVLLRTEAFVQWQEYTGIRHRGERLILNAETVDGVRAVTWESLAS